MIKGTFRRPFFWHGWPAVQKSRSKAPLCQVLWTFGNVFEEAGLGLALAPWRHHGFALDCAVVAQVFCEACAGLVSAPQAIRDPAYKADAAKCVAVGTARSHDVASAAGLHPQ